MRILIPQAKKSLWPMTVPGTPAKEAPILENPRKIKKRKKKV
jgi:hypothetical protein